ncbi:MAG TPA: hypothetical protein VH251_03670, partial [Verrucomicrobiae bacterium]|nr:hypothetical protein [Verrucomicrobiae bacterium]
ICFHKRFLYFLRQLPFQLDTCHAEMAALHPRKLPKASGEMCKITSRSCTLQSRHRTGYGKFPCYYARRIP